MTPGDPRPHAWYAERLAELRGDWLEPGEAAEVLAHSETCERCRAALARLADPAIADDLSGAHVPRAVIARWDGAVRQMTGPERALVQAHLDQCAECRQDLEMLGLVPSTHERPAVAPSSLPTTSVRQAIDRASSTVTERAHRGLDWIRIALSGWAVAATAVAAWLLVLNPGALPGYSSRSPAGGFGKPENHAQGSTGAPQTGQPVTPGTSAQGSAASIQLALLPDVEPAARGAAESVRAIRVGPAQRRFVLEIPTADLPALPDSAATRVELISPGHEAVVARDFTLADLIANRLFVVSLGSVESGRYILRVSFPMRSVAVIERRFVLSVRPS